MSFKGRAEENLLCQVKQQESEEKEEKQSLDWWRVRFWLATKKSIDIKLYKYNNMKGNGFIIILWLMHEGVLEIKMMNRRLWNQILGLVLTWKQMEGSLKFLLRSFHTVSILSYLSV